MGAYGAAAVVRPTARLDGGRLKVLAAIGAFRRGDNVLNLLTKGLIAVSGCGNTDNLVDKARKPGRRLTFS